MRMLDLDIPVAIIESLQPPKGQGWTISYTELSVQSWRLSSRVCRYPIPNTEDFPSLFPVIHTGLVLLESRLATNCSAYYHFLREGRSKSSSRAPNLISLTATHLHRRQGFGRANTKSNSNLKAAAANGASTSNTNVPPLPPLTNSPSVSSSLSMDSNYGDGETKRFFNEKYAKCSVKGNFLTLAAQPKNVELGEWLAHQCMDQQTKASIVPD